jgi:spore coat protein U-like protein
MRPRLLFGLVLSLLADTAFAADSCTVETRDLDFGIYDPTSGQPNDTSGSIGLSCECEGNGCGAIHYSIAINGDDGSGANRAMRSDRGGAGVLRYELYADPNRAALWGSGDRAVGGVFQPSHFGEVLQLTIYGRMPPLQNVGPGSYSDGAQVVVTF